jgi:hypothetical protein
MTAAGGMIDRIVLPRHGHPVLSASPIRQDHRVIVRVVETFN